MNIEIGGPRLTLRDFLRLPELEPALEYIGGRMVQKMSPGRPHSVLALIIGSHLLDFSRSRKLGMIHSELRCTFGGISQVPDLCYIAKGRTPRDAQGRFVTRIRFAPDLVIEILSPGQTVGEIQLKIRSAIRRGVRLAWLVHPKKSRVYISRPGRKAEVLGPGAILDGEGVLPGYMLPFDELFSWQDED